MFDDRPAWQQHALCNTGDASLVDVFFGAGRHDFDGERAKQICAMCTVTDECLAYALEHDDGVPMANCGVWGGLTHRERLQLRRQIGQAS